MPTNQMLLGRLQELRRHVDALPNEVQAWKDRSQKDIDMEAHFSQIQALGVLMSAFEKRQRALLDQLQALPDSEPARLKAFELVQEIIKAQKIWDFFRDKLELRFSPVFKDALWVADTVAWDCYRPVLDRASDEGILARSELREPPLTYLTANFSPATWVRGSRPTDGRNYDLGVSLLPIPVIEMPWDHVVNYWEFLSLVHEVGHDLEADLKLRPSLFLSLQMELMRANVPAARINIWLAWQAEVFADLVALQLAGSAFAESLARLLLLPSAMVTMFNANDPHPTPYVRILMNAAYIRTLAPGRQELGAHAGQLEAGWMELYGKQPQYQGFFYDFPFVFKALMDTPFVALKNKTVRELMPFTAADDQRIRDAAQYISDGQNPPGPVRPRHCISAALFAFSSQRMDAADLDARLEEINKRTAALVRQNAAPGLRAGDDSTPHHKFIARFAASL
jgi:hypothetical protein